LERRDRRATAPVAPWSRSTTATRWATVEPGSERSPIEPVRDDDGRPGRTPQVGVGRLGLGGVLGLDEGAAAFGSQLLERAPREPARQHVAVFPAADGREGHAQGMGQAFLSETGAVTPGANELASVSGRTAGNAGVGGGGVELHSEVHLEAAMSNGHASLDTRKSLRPALGKAPKSPDRVRSIRQAGLMSHPCTLPRIALAARGGGWYSRVWPLLSPLRAICSSA